MSFDEKDKVSIAQVERRPSAASSLDDGELLALDVRAAAERRLVRILDWRLLPTIVLIFIMNYIDVSNVFKILTCLCIAAVANGWLGYTADRGDCSQTQGARTGSRNVG